MLEGRETPQCVSGRLHPHLITYILHFMGQQEKKCTYVHEKIKKKKSLCYMILNSTVQPYQQTLLLGVDVYREKCSFCCAFVNVRSARLVGFFFSFLFFRRNQQQTHSSKRFLSFLPHHRTASIVVGWWWCYFACVNKCDGQLEDKKAVCLWCNQLRPK